MAMGKGDGVASREGEAAAAMIGVESVGAGRSQEQSFAADVSLASKRRGEALHYNSTGKRRVVHATGL